MQLSKISSLPPKELVKKEIERKTKQYCKGIASLQEKLFAQKKHSVLIILQGMDSAGKSSTVRDVFKYVNPMGITIKSYKKPSEEEFAHDFLWRVHKEVPAKGMISIFDRSHYEDILIQRVHNWIDEERVKQRIQHINNFEWLLASEANTKILKFYLHISKDEQEKQLTERKVMPEKFWKHNDNDWIEREHWDKYMNAYEDIFEHCSKDIPWTIAPADKGWYKRYIVSKTLFKALDSMELDWPKMEQ